MLWSTDPAPLRKQWRRSKAQLNNISHSDELLVLSHCWLLYVLNGWCSALAAICCRLSPVPAGTPLLACAFYALCVMSEVISLDVGFIRGMCRNISLEAEIKSALYSDRGRQRCQSQSFPQLANYERYWEGIQMYNHPWMSGSTFMSSLKLPVDYWRHPNTPTAHNSDS